MSRFSSVASAGQKYASCGQECAKRLTAEFECRVDERNGSDPDQHLEEELHGVDDKKTNGCRNGEKARHR